MRVIIELTEDETKSATISRQSGAEQSRDEPARNQIPTSDGGSPSEELLRGLGSGAAQSGVTGETLTNGGGVTNGSAASNAGEPTGWLSIAMGEGGGG
jgi:hypothetical protein